MIQDKALEILKGTDNVFLTGQPGTGKTYLINKYIEWCLDNGIVPTITASTGIAAIHVGGSTLHSFAGVYNDNKLTHEDIEEILAKSWIRQKMTATDILIIDEISMVSAALLDAVDILAREARGRRDKPFGGMRVIFVGDFFQLPPVKGEYAFNSGSWRDAYSKGMKVCYLHEQYRQSDKVFNDILTGVRAGVLDDTQKQLLRDRIVTDASGLGAIRLDTHNANVDKINTGKLQRLEGDMQSYQMSSYGNEKAVVGLIKNCLSPEKLFLKVGAPVLFTKNDLLGAWVNGTQGVVEAMTEYSVSVRITSNDKVVEVPIAEWELAEGYGKHKKVIATIMQIPLKLAWAITIHKSQGMTLDSAVMDVSRAFAPGQGYVAVSRVRSLEGVYFQGRLTKGFLEVDKTVVEMDKEFIRLGM